jgi:16S rRNA (guanine527-N7)-methyltransferase
VSEGFDETLRARAGRAGVQLTEAQIDQLRAYYQLLSRWTLTINLTSLPLAGYPDSSIDRLLIEPLLAARFFGPQSPRWIDLGSGGGSPAIPLRILQAGGSLDMIESRERKTAFLREVVRTLKLERTDVRTTRIEAFATSSAPASADLITMRAVKPTRSILHAAARLLAPGGRLLVFGTGGSAELEDARMGEVGFGAAEFVPMVEPEHRLSILTRR